MPYKKRIRGICIDCGVGVSSRTAKRCRKCSSINRTIHFDKVEYKREWSRYKKYGLEKGEFDTLWVVFRGKCGICNNDLKMPLSTRGQPLNVVAIDHDHITGNIRGLLCNACNKGIGFLKDNPEIILNAYKWVGGKL